MVAVSLLRIFHSAVVAMREVAAIACVWFQQELGTKDIGLAWHGIEV